MVRWLRKTTKRYDHVTTAGNDRLKPWKDHATIHHRSLKAYEQRAFRKGTKKEVERKQHEGLMEQNKQHRWKPLGSRVPASYIRPMQSSQGSSGPTNTTLSATAAQQQT